MTTQRGMLGAGPSGALSVDWLSGSARMNSRIKAVGAAVGALLMVIAAHADAQVRGAPQPSAMPAPIAAPRDVPYPGVMTLSVDIDVARRIFWAKQTIPVSRAGPMVLHYARWIPGNHGPSGPVYNYAGLKITANGQPVPWRRDPVDTFAFHIDVPAGARQLDIEAQYLTPVQSGGDPVLITDELARLQWYATALYPAGHFTRQIQVDARVKLPAGWDYAVGLDPKGVVDGYTTFETVSFETLADSPLIAGEHSRKIDLDPGGRSRVTLNVFADEADLLEADEKVIEIHRELVRQADRLFGARHFDHYDFLLWFSSELGGAGLEHQRSSENGVARNYFRTWDTVPISRDLLPHEYTHSWNGKYRRPADLWTPTFNVPMRDSLLWVYEGQTQYWGWVLAARAGFTSKQQALDTMANTAATYQARIGRTWRPLIDTTNDPINASRRSIPWSSWQRSEDYYSEGSLIWLDVDTVIRERSNGRRSLNDFARVFFGVNDGDWGQMTYDFDDLVAALNRVEPYDWASFLRQRVDEVAPNAPLDGLRRGGYELVFREEPNASGRATEARSGGGGHTYSLGASFSAAGRITSVMWDGPVFRAGLVAGTEVAAINGQPFTLERLRDAVRETKNGRPVELMLRKDNNFETVRIDYAGGLRYPHLQRIEGVPARLDDILTAL